MLLVQNLYWIRRAGEVAVPWGITPTSFVFIELLTLASGGAYFGSPMAAGTLCLQVFAAYLFFGGMLAEFAGTWGGEKVAAE